MGNCIKRIVGLVKKYPKMFQIKIENKTHCKKVQEFLFSKGYSWLVNKQNIAHTYAKYLIIGDSQNRPVITYRDFYYPGNGPLLTLKDLKSPYRIVPSGFATEHGIIPLEFLEKNL